MSNPTQLGLLAADQDPQPEALLARYQSYEQFVEQAKGCQQCGLCTTRTKVVIADGNPQAKLMLIGEGPGEQEDLSGLPFVGRAGQLLDQILQAAKIDRQQETYIANIVKCRPPANRVPTEDEAASCLPYLEYQIAYVNPKLVLLLGATAVRYLLKLKNPKITQLHGQWLSPEQGVLAGRSVMPFYHPSYLLRNQSRAPGSPKAQAWESIQEVRTRLTELSN